MKTYIVEIPITGLAIAEVEAETKDEAIKKAMNSEELEIADWEAHEVIVQGNIFYGMLNEPEVTEQ